MAQTRIRIRVRFMGVEPQSRPEPAAEGWFTLDAVAPLDVAAVLSRFGLDAGSLTVLKGGIHAEVADPVADGEEIHVFLKSMGG
jgi:hypothetical protein